MLSDGTDLLVRGLRINWDKVGKDSYVRDIRALKELEELEFHSNITVFCGENGSGKSTLLEAIAVSYGFNPEGGTKNYQFSTFDSHSDLNSAVRLIKGYTRIGWGYFLRAESFYNVATYEEALIKERGRAEHFHERSHGESFLQMAQHNFTEKGLYLLDEPEAALSPQRQLALICEILHFAGKEAQFIIATHSPLILGIPQAEILSFDHGTIHPICYEETDSYIITKRYLEDPEKMIRMMTEE